MPKGNRDIVAELLPGEKSIWDNLCDNNGLEMPVSKILTNKQRKCQ